MDKETLTALKVSIKHWEENVAAETLEKASVSADDCALCKTFEESCAPCPVMRQTGSPCCRRTPYFDAHVAFGKWMAEPGDAVFREGFRAAAQAELDFLRSLLPVEGGHVPEP